MQQGLDISDQNVVEERWEAYGWKQSGGRGGRVGPHMRMYPFPCPFTYFPSFFSSFSLFPLTDIYGNQDIRKSRYDGRRPRAYAIAED